MRQTTSPRAIPGGSRVFLPGEARRFVERAEAELGVPATLLGTGPGVGDIVDRRAATGRR